MIPEFTDLPLLHKLVTYEDVTPEPSTGPPLFLVLRQVAFSPMSPKFLLGVKLTGRKRTQEYLSELPRSSRRPRGPPSGA